MTDPTQIPLDDTDLDAWFPRDEVVPTPEPKPEQGVYPGFGRQKRHAAKGPSTKNPHKLGKIGESLTKRIMEKFGATLNKSPVHQIVTDGGIFTQSTNVDFVGSILAGEFARSMICDAKAWSSGTFPLTRVSHKERGYFTRGAQARQLCVLSLVIWPKVCSNYGAGGVDVVYLVTWGRWLEIERELAERAKGNYKGKSLRRRDFDLLAGCAVRRESRRWTLEDGHWLTGVMR